MDGQKRFSLGKKVTIIAILSNILLALFKGFAGIVGRSEAVFADAVESVSDVIATTVVWIGLSAAKKPSDFEHPYGHQKIETASAVIVGIIILLSSFGIAGRSVNSIISGEITTPSMIALVAVLITIVVKEGLYQYTIRVGKKINSMAVNANAWDHRKDAITSIATLVGVIGARLGIPILDPIAAVFVAIMILRIGLNICWGAFNELIDISPNPAVLSKIREISLTVSGIEHVVQVRARKTGPYIFVDVEVEMDESMTVRKSHEAVEKVKAKLINELPDVKDVMVHVEPHAPHK